MSRFYEVLRATQTPPGEGAQPFPLSPPDPVTDLPPLLDVAGVTAAEDQVVSPALEDGLVSPAPKCERVALRPAVAAALGERTAVAVNRTARIIPNTPHSAVVEQYRRLRTKLLQQHSLKPFRSVVVTSPGAREGKTVTTVNLAISFSLLPEYRVLIIDADLRRHNMSDWLGIADRPGFGNLLDGSATLAETVHALDGFPIFVIGSGNSAIPAAEMLHSPELPVQMKLIEEQFDLILLDSSPVNLIADTQLLASHTDGVLLIARAFSTTLKAFEKAARDLRPFRVIGTVLNGGARSQIYSGKNGYY